MALPQFPNVYYGTAAVDGPAPEGYIVTAVIDRGLPVERHYSLKVTPKGLYGSGNGLKLKVGGDLQGRIADKAKIEFFVTPEALPMASELTPAGVSYFYSGTRPSVNRLALSQ